MNKKSDFAPASIPLLADGAALLLSFLFITPFTRWLADSGGWQALVLVVGYILFAAGVYLIRRLEATPASDRVHRWQPPTFLLDRRVRGVLAVLFGVVMMVLLSIQLGFLEAAVEVDTWELGEGATAAFFVFAPGSWLGFSLLYVLILAFGVRPTVEADSPRAAVLALSALLATNLMLFVLTAQLRAARAALGWTGGISFITGLLLLLLLFGPPRLLYLEKRPLPLAAYSFLLLLGVSAWQIAA